MRAQILLAALAACFCFPVLSLRGQGEPPALQPFFRCDVPDALRDTHKSIYHEWLQFGSGDQTVFSGSVPWFGRSAKAALYLPSLGALGQDANPQGATGPNSWWVYDDEISGRQYGPVPMYRLSDGKPAELVTELPGVPRPTSLSYDGFHWSDFRWFIRSELGGVALYRLPPLPGEGVLNRVHFAKSSLELIGETSIGLLYTSTDRSLRLLDVADDDPRESARKLRSGVTAWRILQQRWLVVQEEHVIAIWDLNRQAEEALRVELHKADFDLDKSGVAIEGEGEAFTFFQWDALQHYSERMNWEKLDLKFVQPLTEKRQIIEKPKKNSSGSVVPIGGKPGERRPYGFGSTSLSASGLNLVFTYVRQDFSSTGPFRFEVHLWDLKGETESRIVAEEVYTLGSEAYVWGPNSRQPGVHFLAGGEQLLIVPRRKQVFVWNVDDGSTFDVFAKTEVLRLERLPNGKFVVVVAPSRLAVCAEEDFIQPQPPTSSVVYSLPERYSMSPKYPTGYAGGQLAWRDNQFLRLLAVDEERLRRIDSLPTGEVVRFDEKCLVMRTNVDDSNRPWRYDFAVYVRRGESWKLHDVDLKNALVANGRPTGNLQSIALTSKGGRLEVWDFGSETPYAPIASIMTDAVPFYAWMSNSRRLLGLEFRSEERIQLELYDLSVLSPEYGAP